MCPAVHGRPEREGTERPYAGPLSRSRCEAPSTDDFPASLALERAPSSARAARRPGQDHHVQGEQFVCPARLSSERSGGRDATWLVSDGVPLNEVARVMGHEQISTTLDRCTHAFHNGSDRVRDSFADFSLTIEQEEGGKEA
jgi:hypothetical protein